MSTASVGSDYTEAMIERRNAAWMPSLQAQLVKGNTLVAVGAAHLGGDTGLVRLLRASGFKVTPTQITAE